MPRTDRRLLLEDLLAVRANPGPDLGNDPPGGALALMVPAPVEPDGRFDHPCDIGDASEPRSPLRACGPARAACRR